MKWFYSTIEGAGLKNLGPAAILAGMLALALLAGTLTGGALGIPAFGFFFGLGVLAFQFETLTLLAVARRRALAKLWPEVVDSVHSAIVSGLSLSDALDELAISGPRPLRHYFQELTSSLDSGVTLETAIDFLKSQIGEVHADKFCEVLRLANTSGSESLAVSLEQQSENLRSDLALAGQLEAKQSWVVGTAKISVTAPWIVVAMLSVRPENAQVFNSNTGLQVLLIGFVICAVAYRLVHFLGSIPSQPRYLVQ